MSPGGRIWCSPLVGAFGAYLYILNKAAVPGQLMETFRPTGIALRSLQNHWNSLHFLPSPPDGTRCRPPRMWRSPENLTVSKSHWKSLWIPYDTTFLSDGVLIEHKVASDNFAIGMQSGTGGFTGKRWNPLRIAYGFVGPDKTRMVLRRADGSSKDRCQNKIHFTIYSR